MRLDKYLADMSIGTRKEVKEIIKKGRVKVNDIIIKKADIKLNADDIVELDDEIIEYFEYEYYLLNKPSGYVTAREDDYHNVVMDLIISRRKDLAPVGRLDKDTEGVLLITNDGVLNHRLLSSKYHVQKKYYVEVISPLDKNAKEIFSKPMEFSDFVANPAIYEAIGDYHAYITIEEGKYHQVKRMFAKIGSEVKYLRRETFGFLNVDDLKLGEYRALTKEEINKLYQIVGLEAK